LSPVGACVYGRHRREGVLPILDGFISGTEIFGERIQPLIAGVT
jgi:hypothetical protein